jgi:spore maturation protein CgeB
MRRRLNIAFFGSSLVSAYWNGAATYYRGMIRALHDYGHRITFFEPDAYDGQVHRDLPDPPWARVVVYPGTHSPDRQGILETLLIEPARLRLQGHFVVAGPQYPSTIAWPANVQRIEHLPPAKHRAFYNNAQRFTLNLTRADMVRAGYSLSVRLLEAAACATPIISDYWQGLERFFTHQAEILIARTAQDTLYYLRDLPETVRQDVARRARARVLAEHTAATRVAELEAYLRDPQYEHHGRPQSSGQQVVQREWR